MYLLAPWDAPFELESTADGQFTLASGESVDVKTMHGDAPGRVGTLDGVDVFSLPYRGDHLELTLLLPPRESFSTFAAALDAPRLAALLAAQEDARLDVSLPKFKVESGSLSLKQAFASLGMTQAFGASADFSRMLPGVHILDIIHKAFIDVTETGTEGSAATAVIFGDDGEPSTPVEADRPFVYLVRDSSTGAILFLGQVLDPR